MRRYFSFSILAAFSLFFLGCEQLSENNSDIGQSLTVNATYDNGNSKATVFDGGTSVYWEPNDEIKVFCGQESGRLVSTNVENSKTATFTGTVSGEVNPSTRNKLYALYPYREDASFDDGVITTILPEVQTAVAGSFDRNANIAIAVSDSTDLVFRNVCGGLRFTLENAGIKRIVFEANGGEYVAGEFSTQFEDGISVVKEVKDGRRMVILEMEDGSAFETGVWYYMSFLPTTLTDGYTITFITDTERAVISVNKSQTIKRGIYGSISDIDDELEWKDLGYFNIPEDVLNGWHEGACTLKDGEVDDYLLIQKDTLTDRLLFYFNTEGLPEEDGYLLMFEPDSAGLYSMSALHHANEDYCVMYSDEYVSFMKFVDGVAEIFNVPYGNYSETITKASPSLQGSVRHYLSWKRLPDYNSIFEKFGNIVNHEYGELVKSVLEDKLISYGKGWKASWKAAGAQLLFELTSKLDYETLKFGFMGNARARVTNVKRSDNETIEVYVTLDNAQSIPAVLKARMPDGSSGTMNNKVLIGVAAGMDDHPGYYLNKWSSGLYEVNQSSSSFVFYFKIPMTGMKTYYFRPFLIPYASATSEDVFKKWLTLIRYGNAKEFIDELQVKLSNFKQTGCSRISENKYRVTFTIDGEIEGDIDLNGIDWGFRINDDWNDVMASDGQYIPPKSKHFEEELELQSNNKQEKIKLTPFVYFRNSLPNYYFGDPITETITLTGEGCPDENHVHAIDLGLSVKWACCNVGATRPEEYGGYYAWGETEEKSNYFYDETYKFCRDGYYIFTKYVTDSYWGIDGFTDGKTVLEPSDDVAHVKWGGSWRMPTLAEFEELYNNCTSERTTLNGVNGTKFTSRKNGNSIFLPAAGCRISDYLYHAGSSGDYWSSSLYTDAQHYAYHLFFYSGSMGTCGDYRYRGNSVRPVSE